jgi:[acyl-carrier-protein] S-malonyltransferase
VVQAVNYNAPGQVVIAGHKNAVARGIEACKARGAKRAMPLPVSAPFHSSLMQPAAVKLEGFLKNVVFVVPSVPVINNVDVKTESAPEKIKNALVRQAASPVRWVEVIRAMAEQGVTHVVECGPGKVLAGLVKRIDPNMQGLAATDRASLELALATIKGA